MEAPESQFVRHMMPDASEADIEEATRRWFGFLLTVHRIALRREREARDSQDAGSDGMVGDVPHTV